MEQHNKSIEVIFVCSICFDQYKNVYLLREHMINDHKCILKVTAKLENNLHKSSNNNTKITVTKDNKKHEENIENYLPPMTFGELKLLLKINLIYKCIMKGCSYKFDSKEKQETHIRCHSSTEIEKIKDFKCFDCGLEVKTWRNCSGHMWSEHEIDVDLLSCPICSYKAITSVKIWRHMKVHKNWKPKLIRANKKNDDKKSPNENKNKYYSEKTCEICDRKFVNGKTLSKHIKTVHNKIKPFICNICNRKSARKSTWIIHMRQHTDEKLPCSYCPFKARDPSVLKKHEIRHNLKDSRLYKCTACSYKSIQTNALKMHIKYYHPDEYKKIACDQCNFVTITSEKLDAHKRDHAKGLIVNEDSMDAVNLFKNPQKNHTPEKALGNIEISSDCFLPLESTDSIADTGGVTIPAHSEDTQFPNFLNP